MRVADAIAKRLSEWGLDTCFAVTGGGAMHLNDAFGGEPRIAVHYMHHEQACSIAAEGYARIAGKPAILNVTSGPGAINAMNGVFGAFTDSIPMVVVSGQVRLDTMTTSHDLSKLRQLGDQELRTTATIEPMVKAHVLLGDPLAAVAAVDEMVVLALTGRPGPVWLDVPVNIQGSEFAGEWPTLPELPGSELSDCKYDVVLDNLAKAQRPVILAGSGVQIAGVTEQLMSLAESLNIPVLTAWMHDLIPSDHRLFAGRPGTIGTRAGNFVLQAADVVVVLGSRLNIRQISYNWEAFAPDATLIWVDIDEAEFQKPTVSADIAIVADLRSWLPGLLSASVATESWTVSRDAWLSWIQGIRARYEPVESDYKVRESGINSYHLIMEVFKHLREDDIVVCGDATACIVPFQVGRIRSKTRMFSNSGCASMGYDLPAALGASVAAPDRRVICFAGDGSVMMNLQELQTLKAWAPNLLVFILANDGYLSIKQTQSNFFGREFGASSSSGVTFPDFAAVARAFGIEAVEIGVNVEWRSAVETFLGANGPALCAVQLDLEQEFEPRLKSRMEDGRIYTPPLDDMFPFLPREELESVRESSRA